MERLHGGYKDPDFQRAREDALKELLLAGIIDEDLAMTIRQEDTVRPQETINPLVNCLRWLPDNIHKFNALEDWNKTGVIYPTIFGLAIGVPSVLNIYEGINHAINGTFTHLDGSYMGLALIGAIGGTLFLKFSQEVLNGQRGLG